MGTVSFQNKGLIDLRAVTIMGVSAKEGSNPIGFFGTGLKYAIAVILRNGGRLVLHRGLDRYEFDVAQEQIRGQEFGLVMMTDPTGTRAPLGFTTHLGARWEPWMAFREIYCNALDEGGRVLSGRVEPREDATTFWVEHFTAFEDAYGERGKIVLEGEPLAVLESVEVFPGNTDCVHYRRVRAGKLTGAAHFTYNITAPTVLTEDRTLLYSWIPADMVKASILKSTDAAFLERWLTAPRDSWEHKLDLASDGTEPSGVFLDLVEQLSKDFSRPLNKSAHEVLGKHRALSAAFTPLVLDDAQEAQLRAARAMVERLMGTALEYPVYVVRTLGRGVMGLALLREKQILLAEATLNMGSRFLASTLYEETLHLSHGFEDESRDFQNFLLDKLMALAETAYGSA